MAGANPCSATNSLNCSHAPGMVFPNWLEPGAPKDARLSSTDERSVVLVLLGHLDRGVKCLSQDDRVFDRQAGHPPALLAVMPPLAVLELDRGQLLLAVNADGEAPEIARPRSA
jgi:hypothetical protein